VRGYYVDVFAIIFDRNRLTGSFYVFQIELDCFFDVSEEFFPGITLGNTAGQSRNSAHVTPVALSL